MGIWVYTACSEDSTMKVVKTIYRVHKTAPQTVQGG